MLQRADIFSHELLSRCNNLQKRVEGANSQGLFQLCAYISMALDGKTVVIKYSRAAREPMSISKLKKFVYRLQ